MKDRYVVVDSFTGEVVATADNLSDIADRPRKAGSRKPRSDSFMKVYQEKTKTMSKTAKNGGLSNPALRVYNYMLGVSKYRNTVALNQTYVAEEIGISRVQANRGFNELVKKGVIVKGDPVVGGIQYTINADYAYKGNEVIRMSDKEHLRKVK